jgi:hypothetical protein
MTDMKDMVDKIFKEVLFFSKKMPRRGGRGGRGFILD